MTFSACLREHWKVQFTVQRTLPIFCVAWHGVSSRSDGAHVGFRSATLRVLSAIVSFVVVNVIPRDRTGRARRRRGQAAATADCNNDEVRRKDVGFTSASQSRAAGNEIVDISAGENTVRRARNREGGLDTRRGGKDRGGANRERKSHECRTDSNLVERRQPNKLSGTCRHDGSRGLTTVRALQLVDGKQQIKWNLAGTDVCRWCRMLISRRPSRGLCRGWTELDDGL